MSYEKPTIKSNLACTFHRDGTVSYWDIYKQQWDRMNAGSIRSSVLSSLNDNERVRINKMIISEENQLICRNIALSMDAEKDEWVVPTDEDAKRRPMVEVKHLGHINWINAKLLAVLDKLPGDNRESFVAQGGAFVNVYARCRMKASERGKR
jgi:hypothetical protein